MRISRRDASERECSAASLISRSISSFVSPPAGLICTLCCWPVAWSRAFTFTMPFESMAYVTSICGTPRGAGGMPTRSNFPSDLFSRENSRSPCSTWICTLFWLSATVVKISEFLVGIPPAPRGVPQIEVTFAIDSNGIVNVNARDQATGQQQSVQINPAGGLSKDEIDRLINEAAEPSRTAPARRDIRMLQNKLEGMIYTNEKVFREFGKLLNDADRDKVGATIAKAKELVAAEDRQHLNDAIFELQGAARILTSVMLYNPMKMGAPTE